MMHGSLYRAEDKTCLLPDVSRTSNPWERMKGLLGSKELQETEALLIKPCSSVHTFAMRYPIDLAFLNKEWIVVKTVNALKPWRMSACPDASMVLELMKENIEQLGLAVGTQLEWQNDQI